MIEAMRSIVRTNVFLGCTKDMVSCFRGRTFLGNYRTDHPMVETGRLHPPRSVRISRSSTSTGKTQSKKSFCTNSILCSTPYIFALCFAHAILTGSLSIAITSLELHSKSEYPCQNTLRTELCFRRPESVHCPCKCLLHRMRLQSSLETSKIASVLNAVLYLLV